MIMPAATTPSKAVRIEKTLKIEAPIQLAYEALLEQLGPACEFYEDHPMPMKFEAWPGGRWFRDLGDGAGHWWGTVQVIKPPTLIEINGPLFMSYPALSHVQYRLIEEGPNTTLEFIHRAFGDLDDKHAQQIESGWAYALDRLKAFVEGRA